MKITIAQLNPTVGDISGNLEKLKKVLEEYSGSTDLIVFSELFLLGYPPRDLLDRKGMCKEIDDAMSEIKKISALYPETGVLVGMPVPTANREIRSLYNSAVLVLGGEIAAVHNKSLLPAYDVFDETRYFQPATSIEVIEFKGEKLGISICEDMWNDPMLIKDRVYDVDPMEELSSKGATILVNISASPFYAGKQSLRYDLVKSHAKKYGIPFVFVNQVGGNDELVFDGRSMCVNGKGSVVTVLPSFREKVETVDTCSDAKGDELKEEIVIALVHDALVLGVRDYVRKCGFSKAVIGLSGGIDSSVVCAIARKALGGDNVLGVTMPSEYSAKESALLSEELASRLGIEFKNVAITDIYTAYKKELADVLKINEDNEVGVYLQNIQARIRGDILMAFSNKYGHMLLTTGNKSELAVGYCTLYGDMAGGLAVISDLPKTMVYELAEYINRDEEVIPRRIIDRAPSAELRPEQLDEDTLPSYDVLDRIVNHYVEEGASPDSLVKEGFDKEVVEWVTRAVKNNEYKRRQAPPGLKVTTKAFGMGRRMPIASKYDI